MLPKYDTVHAVNYSTCTCAFHKTAVYIKEYIT